MIKIEPQAAISWPSHTHDDRYYTEAESDALYALLATSINTTAPLSGGGTLAATRTLTLSVDSTDLGTDGSNQLYVKDAGIVHDSTTGYSANKHVDHTGVTITLTSPLSGSGDISANRTFSLAGLSTLGTANYVVGANAAASAWEYKQLIAGTNVTISHGVGSVTINATAGGAAAFTDLTDVPAAYTGAASKYVKVKADVSGLEFVAGSVDAHDLTSATHTDSGLTTGHFLKATGATSFAWGAHGLTNTDVGAAATSHTHAWSDVSKALSNLSDLATASHTSLSGVSADQHHTQKHAITSTTDHSVSTTSGYFLKATGTTTWAWAAHGLTYSDVGAAATSHSHATTDITSGTLGVARGGTGAATLTDGAILIGATTGAVEFVADVATGSVLVSGGLGTNPSYSATPTVTSLTATSITPSGLTTNYVPYKPAGALTDSPLRTNGTVVSLGVAPSADAELYVSSAVSYNILGYNTSTSGTAYGGYFYAPGAGGTTHIGLYANATGATNNYGLYITDIAAGSTNYAIYSTAAAKSSLAGDIYVPDIYTKGPFVDVRAYGILTSNGAAANDAAWTTLLAAVTAGSTIYFPKGHYDFSAQLAASKSLSIVGDGNSSIIHQTSSDTAGIYVTGNDVSISNICLAGPSSDSSAGGTSNGIYVEGTDSEAYSETSDSYFLYGVNIENCYIYNWGTSGIRLHWVRNFNIRHNLISEISVQGIAALSSKNGTIIGNNVDHMHCDSHGYGIIVSYIDTGNLAKYPRPKDVSIIGNVVRNVHEWEGIDTHGGLRISCVGNTIAGCLNGIMFGSASLTTGCEYCTISGNTITNGDLTIGTCTAGITLEGTDSGGDFRAKGCTITGNSIYGMGDEDYYTNGSGGIISYGTLGVAITGNTLTSCGQTGIYLFASNEGFTCVGNMVIDPWSEDATVDGRYGVCGVLVGEGGWGGAVGNTYGTITGNTLLQVTTPAAHTYQMNTANGKGISVIDTAGCWIVTANSNVTNGTDAIYDPGSNVIAGV